MLKGTSGAGPRQEFTKTSRPGEFKLEPFTPQKSCTGFQCAVAEYNKNRKTISMRKDIYC
jgi:hypothetical protein